MSRVTCTDCGKSRPDELASGAQRTPCPSCASTAITIQLAVSIEATSSVSATLSVALADVDKGWRRRWEEAQHRLVGLATSPDEELSTDALSAARDRYCYFYIQTYHFKDALIEETGVPRADIEAAIDRDPDLALLADLCNSDKHPNLRQVRSGDVPSITLFGRPLHAGSWSLEVRIDHARGQRDGLHVAQAAVDAWRRALLGWGLI